MTGKTIIGAVVSLDGFIARHNDDVGPLFDWDRLPPDSIRERRKVRQFDHGPT